MTQPTYVNLICHDCAKQHGHTPTQPTWHEGQCDVCKEDEIPVTQGRDYGVYYVRK